MQSGFVCFDMAHVWGHIVVIIRLSILSWLFTKLHGLEFQSLLDKFPLSEFFAVIWRNYITMHSDGVWKLPLLMAKFGEHVWKESGQLIVFMCASYAHQLFDYYGVF
jgi:hypothetical protein